MKDIKSYVIGFLTCACLFLIMGQTQGSNNLGDIEVNSISVKTIDGKETIYIGSHMGKSGGVGMIGLKNSKGDTMIGIIAEDDGGHIGIQNKDNIKVVIIQANDNSDGLIGLYDREGKSAWGKTAGDK